MSNVANPIETNINADIKNDLTDHDLSDIDLSKVDWSKLSRLEELQASRGTKLIPISLK